MTGSRPEDPDRQAGESEYGDDTGAGEPTVGGPGGLGAALPGGPPAAMPGGQAGTAAPDAVPEQPDGTTAE